MLPCSVVCMRWLIRRCDMTCSGVTWHVRVCGATWPIYVCDMTLLCVLDYLMMHARGVTYSMLCVTLLGDRCHVCYITRWYVVHYSEMYVALLCNICYITRWCMSHYSMIDVMYVTIRGDVCRVCDATRWYTLHYSVEYVMCFTLLDDVCHVCWITP